MLVCNATDLPVLVYEGELILGARQNRTMDMPVLIPAGIELRVPVSCVEQGRWDGGQSAAHFPPAAYTADPDLRRAKRATANAESAAGRVARPEQGEVWRDVQERLLTHDVASPSTALTDLYNAKRPALDDLTQRIHAVEGQVGGRG